MTYTRLPSQLQDVTTVKQFLLACQLKITKSSAAAKTIN